MNKFGVLKSRILEKLTEAYQNKNKAEIKEILALLKENKDFREMYLFYDEIENVYVDSINAPTYIQEVTSMLNRKLSTISEISSRIEKKLGNIKASPNKLYEVLDQLAEEDNLHNITKKIAAKNSLMEHITTVKQNVVAEDTTMVTNQPLLYAILANNFNVAYENSLNEEEKKELNDIMSIKPTELVAMIDELKESIIDKTNDLLNEETNPTVTQKLSDVRKEVLSMTATKFNLYKLRQLKDSLS